MKTKHKIIICLLVLVPACFGGVFIVSLLPWSDEVVKTHWFIVYTQWVMHGSVAIYFWGKLSK